MKPERWRQVDELYQGALERAPEERAAFLDQACQGDEGLRREVASLLASDGQAGSFLGAPAVEVAAKGLAAAGTSSFVGRQVGHYEVLALLGAGGMGEVYLGRDTRLGRRVAIKVLPALFARDRDRLRRFEQEARATSALNHPNILTVYDIGADQGLPYMVTELLEGEELRAQLPTQPEAGGLPLRQALGYAQQVACGLAAAHEKGVVHRDLKPENLFVTSDGRLKILDFGLAKLKAQRGEPVDPQASTRRQLTGPGVVMGTVGYMAPEQVRGEEVDHRADIFSFGVILYEMLAGRRPFGGASAVEVMNAILKEEPAELGEANAKAGPPLEKIVRRCLEKQPERRFHSAHDLGFALEALPAPSNSPGAEPTAAIRRGGWRERLPWVLAGAVGLASLALGAAYINRSTTDARAARLAFAPPENVAFGNDFTDSVVVSPDGRKLAFTGRSADGRRQLWVRPLDSAEAQALPGTDDARSPFWSPDSRSLGFGARGKLKRIDLAGGRPQTLCDEVELNGGAWGRAGVILFAPTPQSKIFQIPATGGEARPVTEITAGRRDLGHQGPSFLPDGRHFLYWSGGELGEGVFVASLDAKEVKQVLADNTPAVYVSPGRLLFVRDGALVAQPFDATRLELKGEAVRITRPTNVASIAGVPFSVSENGVLIWQGDRRKDYQLVWFDRAGSQVGTAGPPIKSLVGQGPRFSRDGKRVLFQRVEPETREADIWAIDLAGNLPTRLTTDRRFKSRPIWSPDGSRVVYGTRINIHQVTASGAGAAEVLVKEREGATNYAPTDWSPDGRFMIYSRTGVRTQRGIWALPMTEDREPRPLLDSEFDEYRAQLSPDGRWLAYVSDESGDYEVYVQPFTAQGKLGGGKRRISTGGGNQPRWRRDGRELFYVAADGRMMAVAVKTSGATFEPGTPVALFKTRMLTGTIQSSIDYDVTADGQRFLIGTLVGEPTPVSVILNWTAEAKQ